jgi:sulfite exporter TauE/SafE
MTTAALIGTLHTLAGPDHYLPFVFMARAGKWSRARALVVTLLCGIGHVLGSVLLGVAGIALGVAVARLEWIESARGDIATWALIGFGLAYAAWGLRQAHRGRAHAHVHVHPDGEMHVHQHSHTGEHAHVHEAAAAAQGAARMTPWVLFTIFVLGPCEPLIPLLMVPAAAESLTSAALVTLVFAVCTLVTMVAAVWLCLHGVERLRLGFLERYTHALAGAALALCGIVIRVFEL